MFFRKLFPKKDNDPAKYACVYAGPEYFERMSKKVDPDAKSVMLSNEKDEKSDDTKPYVFCKNCGAKVDKGVFCPECGMPMNPEKDDV